MVARTQPKQTAELVVTFSRISADDESIRVTDGHQAALKALIMIATHAVLQAGDLIVVRRADDLDTIEESLAQLPETSRASHYS